MLTMGKPMRLTCAEPMGMRGEMFGERIRGNLRQMQGRFTPADILHFLSAPPEFYIAETGMTTLVNQRDGVEIENLELSLVNNLLNRILVSGQLQFCYQDRVFVENILKKLGVADVREWIRQVRMIKEETEAVNELLSLYEAGRDTIRQIQEYGREQAESQKVREEERTQESKEAEAILRFSTAVLNRLQTAAVYREVSRYTAFRFGDRTKIERRELSFGEQDIAASYLTLHEFRKQMLQHDSNMVYHLSGRYEALDVSHTDEIDRRMAEYLLQTALLQAISQLFHIRYTDFSRHTGWRHEFMDALHVSVRNTFQRLAGFSERTFLTTHDREAYHRTVQYFDRQEIRALKTLLENRKERMLLSSRDMEALQTAPQEQTTVYESRQFHTDGDTVWQEKTIMRDHPPQEAAAYYAGRMEEIKEWLARIDQQNIERVERLAAYESRTERPKKWRIDRERAKSDALKALANPKQGMILAGERETGYAPESKQETQKLREILGNETVRVFETVRGYQEDPEQYPNVTTLEGRAMNLFLQDIMAAGERQTAVLETGQEKSIPDAGLRLQQTEAESAHPFQGTEAETRFMGRRHRMERLLEKTEPDVELLHRQSERTVNEEKLREVLRTRSSDKKRNSTTFRESVSEKEQVTKIVNAKMNEITRRQDEEIARLIDQNVKRQLDMLSEKVYGKLERRMDAERRRRGL